MTIKATAFIPSTFEKIPAQQILSYKERLRGTLDGSVKENNFPMNTTVLGKLKKEFHKIFSRSANLELNFPQDSKGMPFLRRSIKNITGKVRIFKGEMKNQAKMDTKDWSQIVHEVYASLSHLSKTKEKIESDVTDITKTLMKKTPKKFVEYSRNMTNEEAKKKVDEYARKYIREYLFLLNKGIPEKRAKVKAASIAKRMTTNLTTKDVENYNKRIRQKTLKKRDGFKLDDRFWKKR